MSEMRMSGAELMEGEYVGARMSIAKLILAQSLTGACVGDSIWANRG